MSHPRIGGLWASSLLIAIHCGAILCGGCTESSPAISMGDAAETVVKLAKESK